MEHIVLPLVYFGLRPTGGLTNNVGDDIEAECALNQGLFNMDQIW